MKIAFIFKKDSHFKAVKATALRVCAQYKCEPTFIGIDSDYAADDQLSTVIYTNQKELKLLISYDYVIACLGGYLLNKVIASLRATNTKVISIFPGIVSHYQLDAFISRLNADQVWLNSKADFELYSKICKLMKVKNNGLLYGMPWIKSKNFSLSLNDNNNEAIFFEQTTITPDLDSKRILRNTLIKIFNENKDISFKYKIRDNTSDSYFEDLRITVSKLENVDVINFLTDEEIGKSTYFLSISSSAIIEGLVYDKLCYLINNKLLDLDSLEFFKYSGLKLSGSMVKNETASFNQKWFSCRVKKPLDKVCIFDINKLASLVNIKNKNIYKTKWFIIRLSLRKPTLFRVLSRKNRVIAIQKSFEYLGAVNGK